MKKTTKSKLDALEKGIGISLEISKNLYGALDANHTMIVQLAEALNITKEALEAIEQRLMEVEGNG